MSQPDERAIRSAAEAAINDLQLDCTVERVYEHPQHKEKRCIRFSGDYGKFCDEFRNDSGEENSHQLMREKIKSYFIKMRKSVRVRRGSKTGVASKDRSEGILPGAPLEIVGQALNQTSRLVGEVINQVSGLARSALETEAVVNVELPVAVASSPPAPRKSVKRPAKKKQAQSSTAKSARKSSSRAAKSPTRPAAKKRKTTKKRPR